VPDGATFPHDPYSEAVTIRRLAIGIWEFIRASWTIVGITLALVLVMETCVRVGGLGRQPPVATRDPQASQPWFADFMREFDMTRRQRWIPYLYFGRQPSYAGRYVNIDSAGHRVTPQPSMPAVPVARVFFFGGSTMWGTDQRDDHTIAAEAARRLQGIAGPGNRIQVTNFGETGYVSTQELLALMLALRSGNVPDVAVFFDGINDVFTTVQFGRAGIPQNESKRSKEFELGRAIDRTGAVPGLRRDLRAWRALGAVSVEQSALYDWLQSLKGRQRPNYVAADSAARSVVRTYAENVRLVEALAKSYGFEVVYVWQPNVHTTPKSLTPTEDSLMKGILADDFYRRSREVHLQIPRMLDSAMAALVPGRFVDETSLFRGDTLPVFVDRVGHNTEVAIPHIVDAFWPTLQGAVDRQRVRKHPRSIS
jgi:hypothetical protein